MSINKLKEYDRLYEMGLSPISDKDYDNFKDDMFKKFPNDPYFKSVGSFVDSRDKAELPFVLGSLNKLKTDGSCEKWMSKHNSNDSILITPKLDGVSIAVHFLDGEINEAFLRGDGTHGRSIKNKCKQFIKPIKDKSSLWFRGEIILDHLPDGYTNKRSATAGIINDDNNEKLHLLNVMFYEHINSDSNSEDSRMNFIKSLFPDNSVNSTSMKVKTLDDNTLVYMLKDYKEMWPQYDIDGLVLTLDKSIRENVKYPKNKVSFKVNQEAIFTTVKNIEWNTGRTGRVIPLVYIDPVTIDGSTINKATGHNAKFIKDKFIKKGTKISIVRSGDVIPYIVDVEADDKSYDFPKKCSTCDTPLKEKGVDLICTNNLCPSQTLKTIEHFIKKLGIMNVSLSTIEKLNIDTLSDLYSLTEENIMSLDGFGKKKASHLYNELRIKLVTTPEKLIASMGVPGLGEETASKILSKMTFKEFLESDRYDHIDGIGSVINDSIIKNKSLIYRNYRLLSSHGLKFLEEKNSEYEFEVKIFTLTGSAALKREALVRILESKGARVKGISKNVDFLITNDIESNSSKTKKAKQYNVPILTYDDILDKLGVVE